MAEPVDPQNAMASASTQKSLGRRIWDITNHQVIGAWVAGAGGAVFGLAATWILKLVLGLSMSAVQTALVVFGFAIYWFVWNRFTRHLATKDLPNAKQLALDLAEAQSKLSELTSALVTQADLAHSRIKAINDLEEAKRDCVNLRRERDALSEDLKRETDKTAAEREAREKFVQEAGLDANLSKAVDALRAEREKAAALAKDFKQQGIDHAATLSAANGEYYKALTKLRNEAAQERHLLTEQYKRGLADNKAAYEADNDRFQKEAKERYDQELAAMRAQYDQDVKEAVKDAIEHERKRTGGIADNSDPCVLITLAARANSPAAGGTMNEVERQLYTAVLATIQREELGQELLSDGQTHQRPRSDGTGADRALVITYRPRYAPGEPSNEWP